MVPVSVSVSVPEVVDAVDPLVLIVVAPLVVGSAVVALVEVDEADPLALPPVLAEVLEVVAPVDALELSPAEVVSPPVALPSTRSSVQPTSARESASNESGAVAT